MTFSGSRIDLHSHTCHSDGVETPMELVQKAAQEGIRSLAITDHDTVAALPEAQQAGEIWGVDVLTGIELSTQYQQFDDVHILGYLFDPHHPHLHATLARLQQGRQERGLEILERINALLNMRGLEPLATTEIALHEHGVFTRPHLAQALIEHGYCRNINNAFRDFLIPCNVPKATLSVEAGLQLIAAAGGVCSLAHPGSLTSNPRILHAFLGDLKDMGMAGLEVYHRSHDQAMVTFLRTCTVRYGFVATGGSDYHGRPSNAGLGEMAPGYAIPLHTLQDLRRAHVHAQGIALTLSKSLC